MIKQPTVTIVFTDDTGLQESFVAFDVNGEVLETTTLDANSLPDWSEAVICDHRGAGGEDGFNALVTALRNAEENAKMVGYDIVRVPRGDVMADPFRSEQWKWLVGGKITEVTEAQFDSEEPYLGDVVTVTVEFPKPRSAFNYGDEIPNCKSVRLQVWQDAEGNGAGEIVLIDALTVIDDAPSTVLHK